MHALLHASTSEPKATYACTKALSNINVPDPLNTQLEVIVVCCNVRELLVNVIFADRVILHNKHVTFTQ